MITRTQSEILYFCNKPKSPTQLAKKLKIPARTLRWNLRELRKKGLIETVEIRKDKRGQPIKIQTIKRVDLSSLLKGIVINMRKIDKKIEMLNK